ncbi:MAG: hypothetical protein OMM_06597 [Candidatus Magnetoglobus multicellularis str. Araruama]|uniref:Uncharacterized protein n=1 Tax=Candidatus Magnetoglobus multicellularis str. Araruama TaxID=890399 RepID=A0A1V1PGT6_9BACT|nr:MAG: hypothetical protein OMM_06597 [Candidatus Magnetoglobus multicellularis str. Araruama]
MVLIVYGLLNKPIHTLSSQVKEIKGIDDQPVKIIESNTFYAIISQVSLQTINHPSNRELLAYYNAINIFHKEHSIIPMRFGSYFKSTREMIDYLNKNNPKYSQILNKISGCSEMGVNVISVLSEPIDLPHCNCLKHSSGKDYLMKRKQYYESIDQTEKN